jgi:hypothetical protein
MMARDPSISQLICGAEFIEKFDVLVEMAKLSQVI